MKILTLDTDSTLNLTITPTTVRVNKSSSTLKRSLNKIFLKRWNSKKNVKILVKEFGEGIHDVSLSFIFENLIDNKKAAKKAAKKIIDDNFKEVINNSNNLAESDSFEEIKITINDKYTVTKELLTAIRKQAKCSDLLKISKFNDNEIIINRRKTDEEEEDLEW